MHFILCTKIPSQSLIYFTKYNYGEEDGLNVNYELNEPIINIWPK